MKGFVLLLFSVLGCMLLVDITNACDSCARGRSVARARSVTIERVERAPRVPLFQRRTVQCAPVLATAMVPVQTMQTIMQPVMVPVQVPVTTYAPIAVQAPVYAPTPAPVIPQRAPCLKCPQQQQTPQVPLRSIEPNNSGGGGAAAAASGGGGAAASASGR